MAFLRFLVWLTARRLRANWRLALASGFGVLLAVTLTAVAVLYSRVLAEAGIRYAIENNTGNILLNHELFLQNRPMGHQDYLRLDDKVVRTMDPHLGWLITDRFRFGRSEETPFVYNRNDLLPEQDIPMAYLHFRERFTEYSELVEGRWPNPPTQSDGVLWIEGVLGDRASDFLGWSMGMTIFLVPFPDAQESKVALTVVGVAAPRDSRELYWFNDLGEFRVSFEAEEEDGDFVVPVYVGEQGFFQGMAASYPMLLAEYRWYTALDYPSLNAARAVTARDGLEAFEAEVNLTLPRALSFTTLGNLVNEWERDLRLALVLLFVFIVLIVGVVLYYLTLLAVLLARDRGAEAAVLRSRGASIGQAGALLGLGEGLIITLPAMLAGPFLGLIISQQLPIGAVERGAFHVGLSPSVFVATLGAGALCIGVFLAAGMGTASQSIVRFLRERAEGTGRRVAFRYTLDAVVLLALALFLWQTGNRGGLLTRDLEESALSIDMTLLLGPFLVLAAAALVLLRLMPWLLQGTAKAVSPLAPLWLLHGIRRMARDPLAYGTLSVLLLLATALGVFGAMFGATLARSQGDEVRYEVGGDIVMSSQYVPNQIEGAEAVMPLYRGRMTTQGSDFSGGPLYNLLAVNPLLLPKVTWFRDDLAEKPLQETLRPLRLPLPVDKGVIIPQGADRLGLWVKSDKPFVPYEVVLLVKDSRGRYMSRPVGKVGDGTWTYLENTLIQTGGWDYPLRLIGVLVKGEQYGLYGKGSLAIDDVSATVNGEQVSIEDFEQPGEWNLVPNISTAQDKLELTEDAAYSGELGALFSWAEPVARASRGLLIPPVPLPIPAVGSDTFHIGQRVIGRLEGQAVAMEVQEVVAHFPTLYKQEDPFLLVSQEHLITYFTAVGAAAPISYSEAWIGLADGADPGAVTAGLQARVPLGLTVLNREALAARAEQNPLKGGAWAPMALVATGAIGSVAILGFILYAGISIRRTRLELGVLRAVGFTQRQVTLLLTLEGSVIATLGIIAGGVIGFWLGNWTLGYLSVTAAGKALVPPLELTRDTWLATVGLTQVLLASLAAILMALVLAARLRLYEVLRVEE